MEAGECAATLRSRDKLQWNISTWPRLQRQQLALGVCRACKAG